MRAALVIAHRWLGLLIAAFLLISGLTGAVIGWDHELDEWLNPHLFNAQSTLPAQAPLALAEQLEARDPRLLVSYLPLHVEPGHNLQLGVVPRKDANGVLPTLDFDQVMLDPGSGEVAGQRLWGEMSLSRESIMAFLYKLHYSLHIPDAFNLPVGMLLLGMVSVVWIMDSVIALWIAFPARRSWRKSLAFRWRTGGYKLNFDLHRSGGVWIWVLLLVMAVTSVSLNLQFQVMRPLVSLFSPLSANPFGERDPLLLQQAPPAQISRLEAIERATSEARQRGITAPPGGLFYSPEFDLYSITFFAAGADHGDGGLGNPWMTLDAQDGRLLSFDEPGQGSAGDLFMQAQFPLHSGRILGLPGRILVSVLGVLIAMLSLTGIVIWLRKRASRRQMAARAEAVISTQAAPAP